MRKSDVQDRHDLTADTQRVAADPADDPSRGRSLTREPGRACALTGMLMSGRPGAGMGIPHTMAALR